MWTSAKLRKLFQIEENSLKSGLIIDDNLQITKMIIMLGALIFQKYADVASGREGRLARTTTTTRGGVKTGKNLRTSSLDGP